MSLIVLPYRTRRTVPASPLTSSSWPSWRSAVAFPVPTTAGMPRHLAGSGRQRKCTPALAVTAIRGVGGVRGLLENATVSARG